MAITRSMTRNQNRDAASWSDLNHQLLYLVMMQLGIIDFLAFGCVCKSWRSLALNYKKFFMASRPPMLMSISDRKKELYLQDLEGRKFKTILPHSAGRDCIGLTCGYLILFERKTQDFWLVNPITRNELHFPCFPFNLSAHLARYRAILVSSPLVSGWAFVMLDRFTDKIWFSIAGTRSWNHVSSNFLVLDIHAFKGKIYTISVGYRLCEMRLNPEPKLTVLQTKNFPDPGFLRPEFVSLDENLYVMDQRVKDSYKVHELDFDEMEWVSSEKTTGGYAFFVNDLKYSAAIKQELWADHWSQCVEYAHFLASNKRSLKSGSFALHMWYFPNDCMNVTLLDE